MVFISLRQCWEIFSWWEFYQNAIGILVNFFFLEDISAFINLFQFKQPVSFCWYQNLLIAVLTEFHKLNNSCNNLRITAKQPFGGHFTFHVFHLVSSDVEQNSPIVNILLLLLMLISWDYLSDLVFLFPCLSDINHFWAPNNVFSCLSS